MPEKMIPCRSWGPDWGSINAEISEDEIVLVNYRLRCVHRDEHSDLWWWDIQFEHDHAKPIDLMFSVTNALGDFKIGRVAGFQPGIIPASILVAADAGTAPIVLKLTIHEARETTI